jgi:hypothetical protein
MLTAEGQADEIGSHALSPRANVTVERGNKPWILAFPRIVHRNNT